MTIGRQECVYDHLLYIKLPDYCGQQHIIKRQCLGKEYLHETRYIQVIQHA